MAATKELTKAPASITSDGIETTTEISHELQATPESQRAIAEIRGAILMARHFPRDEDKAFAKIGKMCKRPAFAEDASYSFPRGGTTVEGPSINLARGLAAAWGNIRYGKRVLRDDGETILIEAFAWDMEANTYVTDQDEFKSLVQRKNKDTKRTEWVTPDERDKRELINRRGAICTRNCLLQVLPKDVVDMAFDDCKETVRKGYSESREDVVRKLITAFSGFAVEPEDLERWLANKRDVDEINIRAISADELAELRGILTSIRDGNSSPSDHFGKPKSQATHEKGSLDPATMKPGDGKTNTGFENAPKGAPAQGSLVDA